MAGEEVELVRVCLRIKPFAPHPPNFGSRLGRHHRLFRVRVCQQFPHPLAVIVPANVLSQFFCPVHAIGLPHFRLATLVKATTALEGDNVAAARSCRQQLQSMPPERSNELLARVLHFRDVFPIWLVVRGVDYLRR